MKTLTSKLGLSLITVFAAITLVSFKSKPETFNGAKDFTINMNTRNGRVIISFLDEQNGKITTFDSNEGDLVTKKINTSHSFTITFAMWPDPNYPDSASYLLQDDTIGLDLRLGGTEAGSQSQSAIDLGTLTGLSIIGAIR
jgi:hypothetical protein